MFSNADHATRPSAGHGWHRPAVRAALEILPPAFEPVVVAYPPDRVLSYERLTELILDTTPDKGTVVLLGESFSGPLALMVAARRSVGLCAVVLCASFVRKRSSI